MMRKIKYPFRFPVWEIKKDNAFRKTVQSKVVRTTIIVFMRQCSMFFYFMCLLYIYISYAIIIVVLFEPISFYIPLLMLFMLRIFVITFKNLHPKAKKNFLKRKNVYEKYLEVTKDIE